MFLVFLVFRGLLASSETAKATFGFGPERKGTKYTGR